MTFERFSDRYGENSAEPAVEPKQAAPDETVQVLALVERMEHSRRPEAFTDRHWFTLLKDLRTFAEQHLVTALQCGWCMHDLFGCHPVLTAHRWDLTGITLMLGGREVIGIDADRITIANRLGAPNTFYRQQPGCSVPAERKSGVLIWAAVLAEAERAR